MSAGAIFPVAWTGPNNARDFITLVRKDAPDDATGIYHEVRVGPTFEFTAPILIGEYELRYIAARSRQVLGRAPVTVTAIAAKLEAADQIVLGGAVSVVWQGPDNAGDYVTLVLKETPDGQFGNFTYTREGSPLTVRAPVTTGEAELRYMTGQGEQVIGRRAIRIILPDVSLSAPAVVIAGSTIAVAWVGPNNPGDFVTIVPRATGDGGYGNYTYTREGSPMSLLAPLITGEAELRYMTGQGNKVIARRAIELLAVEASLSAAPEGRAGTAITITWTGPNYAGDYITIVPANRPDGEFGEYLRTNTGSPLDLKAPDQPGDCEIRYMTGQGGKVLARVPIRINR